MIIQDETLPDILDRTYHKPTIQSNATPSEITITIKDDEKRLVAKYLIYEKYQVDIHDDVIGKCIADTMTNFQGEPESVKVRINLSL